MPRDQEMVDELFASLSDSEGRRLLAFFGYDFSKSINPGGDGGMRPPEEKIVLSAVAGR